MEDKTQSPAQDGISPVKAKAQNAELTMEDIMTAEQEPQKVTRGDIIEGTIVFIGSDSVVVNIGATKVEGIVPFSELGDEPMTSEQVQEKFKIGDSMLVYVVSVDMLNNQIQLSKKRADDNKGWRVLDKMYKEGQIFEVEISEKVRGGLVAQIEGVRAFLPASQIDSRRINDLDSYVGKPLKVKIIELVRRSKRAIISHRVVVEEAKEAAKQQTMDKLEPGTVLEGKIVEITEFGVFVNLGGLDGLVHRSELTYSRFNHPREAVKIGDVVKVQVLDIDAERERINLSMKVLTDDPWEGAMDRYEIGQRVTGKVTNITQFGAFLELEPGLEGLIHISEMSWTKRIRHPNEVLKEGEDAEAVVLRMDPVERRISLGIRQTTQDPWSVLPDRYPPGTSVKGKITGITEFGIFMEIEDGIEGLVHISELDGQSQNRNLEEEFKKGDELEAVIINIDPVEQRASLSRRHNAARNVGNNPADLVSQGGGKRTERSRRSSRDYNYSAKEASQGGKVSTKLGDVYADLFAQFGMSTDTDKDKKDK